MRRREINTVPWSENRKGRDHLEDLVVNGRTILERIPRKYGGKAWTGLTWVRTGTSGRCHKFYPELLFAFIVSYLLRS
jgi:hypothetical protein